MAPRYLVWVRALVTGIRHFFVVLYAFCDSWFITQPSGFDYSATNINRRDAEFAETWNLPYYQHLKRMTYLLLSKIVVSVRSSPCALRLCGFLP